MVLGIGSFFLASQLDTNAQPVAIIAGILMFLGGLIFIAITARSLRPSRIDNQHLWLKGVCNEMLDTLPATGG